MFVLTHEFPLVEVSNSNSTTTHTTGNEPTVDVGIDLLGLILPQSYTTNDNVFAGHDPTAM